MEKSRKDYREKENRGVLCVKCIHFRAAAPRPDAEPRCERYNCEIVGKLTLRVDCPEYQRKPLVISLAHQEYMKKYRAEHIEELRARNREYMRKKRLENRREENGKN